MPGEGTISDRARDECFWCGKGLNPLASPRFGPAPTAEWEGVEPPTLPVHADCLVAAGAGNIAGNQRLAIRFRQRMADLTNTSRFVSDGWPV